MSECGGWADLQRNSLNNMWSCFSVFPLVRFKQIFRYVHIPAIHEAFVQAVTFISSKSQNKGNATNE